MQNSSRPRVAFVGNDPQIVSVLRAADRAATSDATVLIHGESGAGKTLLAERIHALSARGDRRLGTIHCSALPESRLEEELFGDTVATALGGTVVIDEVADLPLRLQGMLVDMLERADRDMAS